MSLVKSFATGYGDTYFIEHNSSNFSIIDCRIRLDRDDILDEIENRAAPKAVVRFISTHPDEDHFYGLKRLDDRLALLNFYAVKNKATKNDDTEDFERYCQLRDSGKAYYLHKGCRRRWMNIEDDEHGSSGLSVLWPKLNNSDYQAALEEATAGSSPNNISIILKYSLEEGVRMLWLGDLETDFMAKIEDEIELPEVDIVFAAHHGRARMPASWIRQMNPRMIVLGEAPLENLVRYDGRDHIRQNATGDIAFQCETGVTHVFVGSDTYSAPFLADHGLADDHDLRYLGSLPSGS